jgi:hypothetical protein
MAERRCLLPAAADRSRLLLRAAAAVTGMLCCRHRRAGRALIDANIAKGFT